MRHQMRTTDERLPKLKAKQFFGNAARSVPRLTQSRLRFSRRRVEKGAAGSVSMIVTGGAVTKVETVPGYRAPRVRGFVDMHTNFDNFRIADQGPLEGPRGKLARSFRDRAWKLQGLKGSAGSPVG